MEHEATRARRKQRLLDLVQAEPGIDGNALCQKTRRIDRDERTDLLEELQLEELIHIRIDRDAPGRPRRCYWPVTANTPAPQVSEEEREALLTQLRAANSARINWRIIKAVIDRAMESG